MSRFLILGAGYLVLAAPLVARQAAIPFDARWQLSGDSSQLVTVDGRTALQLVTGGGTLQDIALQDGTIDVDVMFPDQRAFIYVRFRMVSDTEFEEFYFRPHKSDLPDAVQYAPVFQGSSAWQFYHGPGGAEPAVLPPDRWTRVRVVVQGRQAAIFIGDTTRPAMVVPRLAREPVAGFLSLRSSVPAQPRPSAYGARFANLVVRPGDVRYQFPEPPPVALRLGLVTAWAVGHAFVPDTGARQAIPVESVAGGLRSVEVEPDKGFVLLHRHVPMPTGVRRVGVVAQVRVEAAAAGVRRFNLGFSDEVSVYLNGHLLFSGDARYSFDEPRRDGLIGLDQASLYLPLRAGANELTVVVVDGFGGWGVMGQFEDPAGLVIKPGG